MVGEDLSTAYLCVPGPVHSRAILNSFTQKLDLLVFADKLLHHVTEFGDPLKRKELKV